MFGSINENIPLRDELYLSPIQKYQIYKRFPFRVIIDTLLTVALTIQIIMVFGKVSTYTRTQERYFHSLFVNKPSEFNIKFNKKSYIYKIDALKEHIQNSIKNYYDMMNTSLSLVDIDLNKNITLEINYNKNVYYKKNINNLTNIYFLNSTYYGPFAEDYDINELKKIIRHTKFFTLNYKFSTKFNLLYRDVLECFNWNIKQMYSFASRSHFELSLDIEDRRCNDIDESYRKIYLWVHLSVLILSFSDILCIFIDIVYNEKIYFHVKSLNLQTHYKDINSVSKWELLTNTDKRRIYKYWNFIVLLGNTIQILATVLFLIESSKISFFTQLLLGIGCCICYVNMTKYLYYIPSFFNIFSTMIKSIPNLLKYFTGVVPIFLAFSFFAFSLFYRSERFQNISLSMITLFSMMNGDSVDDIIQNINGTNSLLGLVYGYVYSILSIAVIINVFVSIIEEAYVSSKMTNQNHWIYSFLKIKEIDKNDNKEMTDHKRKIYEKVRSKNILRDAIMVEMADINNNNQDNSNDNKLNKSVQLMNDALEEMNNYAINLMTKKKTIINDELISLFVERINRLKNYIKNKEKI